MKQKFHIKKGDQVEVISGNHKGSIGKVLQIIAKKNQALVEGVRLVKKHQKKNQDNPQGSILEQEGAIHVSNLKLIEKGENQAA
jgi:large subunit ribosomal protein L24